MISGTVTNEKPDDIRCCIKHVFAFHKSYLQTSKIDLLSHFRLELKSFFFLMFSRNLPLTTGTSTYYRFMEGKYMLNMLEYNTTVEY
jgi:hypothetical protein